MTWLAKAVGKLPVVGSFLEAMLTAPRGVQRLIGVMLFLLVIYPAFVVFGVLGLVWVLPEAARAPARQYILSSVGFDDEARMISTVNRSNQTVDGSTPMSFAVETAQISEDRYYQVVDRNQAISFWTYQKRSSRFLKDPKCLQAEPADEDAPVGTLLIRTPDRNYMKTIFIPQSFTGLSRLPDSIGPEDWKKINQTQLGNGPVQLLIRFRPDPRFVNTDDFRCQSALVFVNMTFLKPLLSGTKAG